VSKKIIEQSISTIKNFSYKNDSVSLSFSLNVDNSGELRNFLSILTAAKADVEKELEEMKN
jgi:hypothetical protein